MGAQKAPIFNVFKMELGNFKIYRKEGWILNPNDNVVNGILKGLVRNEGHCPCQNKYSGTNDSICPCKAYREEDCCCCTLYIKE